MFSPIKKDKVKMIKNYMLHKWEGVDNLLNGRDCFILASGGSVRNYDLTLLKDKFVIAINHSSVRYPECDALMFSDAEYWRMRKDFILGYEGMIFCGKKAEWWNDNRSNVCIFEYNNITPQLKIADGVFYSGLTGIAAVNLAIIMGAGRIFMLGYDLNVDADVKQIEESNPEGARKYYNDKKWTDVRIKKFAAFMPWADKIYNCSPISSLTFFQYIDYEEAVKL